MAVSAYLVLPIGPVPVSMQPMAAMLAGFILGPVYGGAAVLLYIFAGCIGLPVFAGGRSGVAYVLGPTGGYLVGLAFQAALTGLANRGEGRRAGLFGACAWGMAGLAAEYGLGLLWLAHLLDFGLAKAMAVGFVPFFPWDLIKLGVAVAVFRHLDRRRLLP
ncbi:MAG: biotin transporter BioY [Desulfovibrionaceae bacterium]|jgi:biotin transport system substrate-specific component|nr:biotin transporter BioY [Desulfovibrionaceae bacterium]